MIVSDGYTLMYDEKHNRIVINIPPTMTETSIAVVRLVLVNTLMEPKFIRTPNRAAPIATPTTVLVFQVPTRVFQKLFFII